MGGRWGGKDGIYICSWGRNVISPYAYENPSIPPYGDSRVCSRVPANRGLSRQSIICEIPMSTSEGKYNKYFACLMRAGVAGVAGVGGGGGDTRQPTHLGTEWNESYYLGDRRDLKKRSNCQRKRAGPLGERKARI